MLDKSKLPTNKVMRISNLCGQKDAALALHKFMVKNKVTEVHQLSGEIWNFVEEIDKELEVHNV